MSPEEKVVLARMDERLKAVYEDIQELKKNGHKTPCAPLEKLQTKLNTTWVVISIMVAVTTWLVKG